MTDATDDQIDGLMNALQLCCNSQIMGWHKPSHKNVNNAFVITFAPKASNDAGLKKFDLLVQGQWGASQHHRIENYAIQNLNQMEVGQLTNFLLLTRLQDEQVASLATQDARFRPFAEALGLIPKTTAAPIVALSDIRDIIFKTIDQKGLSLKTVAELTGISQVSLSNFKAGNDIRISTLLKIARALGIKVLLG